MHEVLQNVLAFVAGAVISCLLIMVIEAIGHKLYPVVLDTSDRKGLKIAIDSLPFAAFFFVELAYLAGSFAGGYTIGTLAARKDISISLGLGLMLTGFGVQNMNMIPHPLWFAILTTATYIPFSMFGCFVATKRIW